VNFKVQEAIMKKYLEELYKLKVFHFKDAKGIFGSEDNTRTMLQNYKKEGLIIPIRRDLYTVSDLSSESYLVSKFEIGSNITSTSYLSYHSALEYHGIAHQVFYELYIMSQNKFNEFEFDGITYKHCKQVIKSGIEIPANDLLVRVTDLERTVIDCIDRIDYAGGLEELINSFSLITYLDENKLKEYLESYNKAFLFQKAGFLLSYFKEETKLDDDFFSYCKKNTGKSTRYLTTKEETSAYFLDWKLCAPENILSILEQGGNEII